MPVIILMGVLFPAPFWPRLPPPSAGRTRNETSSTAVVRSTSRVTSVRRPPKRPVCRFGRVNSLVRWSTRITEMLLTAGRAGGAPGGPRQASPAHRHPPRSIPVHRRPRDHPLAHGQTTTKPLFGAQVHSTACRQHQWWAIAPPARSVPPGAHGPQRRRRPTAPGLGGHNEPGGTIWHLAVHAPPLTGAPSPRPCWTVRRGSAPHGPAWTRRRSPGQG